MASMARHTKATDVITIPQAARRLGVSEETLRRLAREEGGRTKPAYVLQIGSSYRVSVPLLERYLLGELAA